MMIKFIRAIEAEDKAGLLRSVASKTADPATTYSVSCDELRVVDRTPFAYWVSSAMRDKFAEFQPFEVGDRSVKQGLSTTDDFRFVRTWWSQPAADIGRRCHPLVSGGSANTLWRDVLPVLRWNDRGRELYAHTGIPLGRAGAPMRNPEKYFLPGFTWPLRGSRFSVQLVPAGCIFTVAGKMAFAPEESLPALAAIASSAVFDSPLVFFAGKVGGVQYEVGLIRSVPVPPIGRDDANRLAGLSQRGWSVRRRRDTASEISHAFLLPLSCRSTGRIWRSA